MHHQNSGRSDNTNPLSQDRARYMTPARTAGFRVSGYFFETTVHDAIRRNNQRASCMRKMQVLESPLIPHLLGKKDGVCRGRGELRGFFEAVATRKPAVRKYCRTGFLTDGKRLIWEYPRSAPQGEQMDFVEAMEINDDGLIQHHCVYCWFGFSVLQRDEYHR